MKDSISLHDLCSLERKLEEIEGYMSEEMAAEPYGAKYYRHLADWQDIREQMKDLEETK